MSRVRCCLALVTRRRAPLRKRRARSFYRRRTGARTEATGARRLPVVGRGVRRTVPLRLARKRRRGYHSTVMNHPAAMPQSAPPARHLADHPAWLLVLLGLVA